MSTTIQNKNAKQKKTLSNNNNEIKEQDQKLVHRKGDVTINKSSKDNDNEEKKNCY